MKRKLEDATPHDPVLDVMSSSLYTKTLGSEPPDISKLNEINEQLSQKYIPKNIQYFPVYADQPDSWQMDLMFEPYINSKKEKLLVAILCVININTKHVFAEPIDYSKNYKAMEELEWNANPSRLLLNNKSAPLVLRSFQRILRNMQNEEQVLNDFEELHGQVHLRIRRLFADEGRNSKDRLHRIVRTMGSD